MTHQEYLKLIKKVNKFRNDIHIFGIEDISESALDDLKHKITIFESQNPDLIDPNSPNFTIAGGILENFKKVKHIQRMVSLNDIFSLEELLDWEKRYIDYATRESIEIPSIKYWCEAKIDGLAISLHYKNGQLIKAITRGNSYEGEDITENIKMVNNIPKFIDDNRYLEVRGELFFTLEAFNNLNNQIRLGNMVGVMGKTGESAIFSNPRNAASGTIRQLDSSIVKERNLSYIAYNIFDRSEFMQ